MEIEGLPADPAMLLSYINTKLRDDYATGGLDELCADMHIDRDMLEKKLSEAGFEYSREHNRFW